MVKKALKSKSKRVPAKRRYKIEKKVRDHNRKLSKIEKQKKRDGKANSTGGKKKKKIHVPGDCPFKDKIISESMTLKAKLKDDKNKRREELRAVWKAKTEAVVDKKRGITLESVMEVDGQVNSNPRTGQKSMDFEELRKKAEERGYIFEQIESAPKDSSLKAFYREFQQVINDSDVILQVLDARDPLGTRSPEAEAAVRACPDKRLILILNKCDLVPIENLKNWVVYLKQIESIAVLPFKANTQKQKNRLGSIGAVNTTDKSKLDTKKSVGVSELLGLLGNWSRGVAGGLVVGVIGMPNVGKSSIINSIKRSKACNVGAKPGVTRTCQFVQIDSKLSLVDSPGVCFPSNGAGTNQTITIETILKRVPKDTLIAQYLITEYANVDDFLTQVANKYGMIKRGGVPNAIAAEEKVLNDWNKGTIRFFTEPPEIESTTVQSTILSNLSEPFSLENFEVKPLVDEEEMDHDDDDEDENEVDEDEDEEMEDDQVSDQKKKKKNSGKKVKFSVQNISNRDKRKKDEDLDLAIQKRQPVGILANKRGTLKKIKKAKKKSAKKANELSTKIENFSF